MAEKLIHSTITEKIIQSFFIVTKTLPNADCSVKKNATQRTDIYGE